MLQLKAYQKRNDLASTERLPKSQASILVYD